MEQMYGIDNRCERTQDKKWKGNGREDWRCSKLKDRADRKWCFDCRRQAAKNQRESRLARGQSAPTILIDLATGEEVIVRAADKRSGLYQDPHMYMERHKAIFAGILPAPDSYFEAGQCQYKRVTYA